MSHNVARNRKNNLEMITAICGTSINKFSLVYISALLELKEEQSSKTGSLLPQYLIFF